MLNPTSLARQSTVAPSEGKKCDKLRGITLPPATIVFRNALHLAQEPLKNEKGCKVEGAGGGKTEKSFLMANQNTGFHFLREIWHLVPNYHTWIEEKTRLANPEFCTNFQNFFCLHVICRSTIRTRKLPEI